MSVSDIIFNHWIILFFPGEKITSAKHLNTLLIVYPWGETDSLDLNTVRLCLTYTPFNFL